MNLAIVGAGSWGTALSIVLAPRATRLRLWVFEADLAERMRAARENDVFLPGCRLPDRVEVVTALEAALEEATLVLGVMPSRHARSLYGRMRPHLDPAAILVSERFPPDVGGCPELLGNLYTRLAGGSTPVTVLTQRRPARRSFEPRAAAMVADYSGPQREIMPRHLLRQQVAKAAAAGYDVEAAFEFEFILLNETADSLRASVSRLATSPSRCSISSFNECSVARTDAGLSGCSRMASSTSPRRIVSGVRSSCAASAVKRRSR